jgi:L,D-peptidoglycan transpeptidase YkuD (ErfK/YbiS/YcfS/YnhG family)
VRELGAMQQAAVAGRSGRVLLWLLCAACQSASGQARGPISARTTQLLVVLSDDFDSTHAQLTRYARAPGKSWQHSGTPSAAMLGYAGYAWGDGLHGRGAPAGRPGPLKREGDGRSPAGIFALGTVHGYAPAAHGRMPYLTATDEQRCVDDPSSRYYNRIVSERDVVADFASAERMKRRDAMYEIAIDVQHNRDPVVPGDGSCIFIHVWAAPNTPVSGCTGLARSDLLALANWLEPDAALLVALPRAEYRALRTAWSLP